MEYHGYDIPATILAIREQIPGYLLSPVVTVHGENKPYTLTNRYVLLCDDEHHQQLATLEFDGGSVFVRPERVFTIAPLSIQPITLYLGDPALVPRLRDFAEHLAFIGTMEVRDA